MKKLKDLLARAKRTPWIAHVLRMQDRFGTRLGTQFAGAITYFSVLALIPLLMVAFSGIGFTLTVVRPELLQVVDAEVARRLAGMGTALQQQISTVVARFLNNWGAIGVVGLLSGLYSAAGWAGNLKSAIRAQTRAEFDLGESRRNIVLETLINIALLLGLIVLIPVTLALANASTVLTGWVLGVLHLEAVPGAGVAVRIIGPVASIAAGWLLFVYILTVFPEKRFPFRVTAWAAVIGTVGLTLLEYLASFLVGAFTGNPAAALFGPVIVLMLFFNLFARLILYVAAWMATAVQQANPLKVQDIDAPLGILPPDDDSSDRSDATQAPSQAPTEPTSAPTQPTPAAAQPTPAVAQPSASQSASGSRYQEAMASPPGTPVVGRSTAVRAARAALRTGWVTGAAAGMGLGALLTAGTRRMSRRR